MSKLVLLMKLLYDNCPFGFYLLELASGGLAVCLELVAIELKFYDPVFFLEIAADAGCLLSSPVVIFCKLC